MLRCANTEPLRRGLALSAFFFFFFNDTATTEIYTLSLHDALPICPREQDGCPQADQADERQHDHGDRKSTRLNSSHSQISYAVFCLKKKKQPQSISPRIPKKRSLHRHDTRYIPSHTKS